MLSNVGLQRVGLLLSKIQVLDNFYTDLKAVSSHQHTDLYTDSRHITNQSPKEVREG